MSNGKVIGQAGTDGWRAWAVGILGAIAAFGIGAFSGAGSDQAFIQPGQDVGFALGYGLGIGLLVWLVLNFTALRGHAKVMRLAAFVLMVVGGTFGVLQNL